MSLRSRRERHAELGIQDPQRGIKVLRRDIEDFRRGAEVRRQTVEVPLRGSEVQRRGEAEDPHHGSAEVPRRGGA